MRKLDRNTIVPPDILLNPAGIGVIETGNAIVYFSTKKKPPGKGFKYDAYANEEVKIAVSKLSNNKCAYCETAALAGFDGDIEHFRPKGEVTVENSTSLKPGYYWLAAKWENLYLSCQHCNQSRKQPTTSGKKLTMGKKNQFPLSDNKKRVRSHKKKIDLEEPYRLLIDPCLEDPLDHLEFDDKGLVFAKKNQDQVPSIKGQVSIEVFALVRMKLVEARQMHAVMVNAALKSYEENAKDLQDNENLLPPAYVAKRKLDLEEQINKLKAFTREDQVFSGMSLHIIKEFLGKRGIVYP